MISYINTNEVNNVADELLKAANKLEKEFESLFSRLENVPTITREWTGNQAELYFSTIILDKQQYITFVNELKSISNVLKDAASNSDTYIEANNNE